MAFRATDFIRVGSLVKGLSIRVFKKFVLENYFIKILKNGHHNYKKAIVLT